jgi:hypothetical protein
MPGFWLAGALVGDSQLTGQPPSPCISAGLTEQLLLILDQVRRPVSHWDIGCRTQA